MAAASIKRRAAAVAAAACFVCAVGGVVSGSAENTGPVIPTTGGDGVQEKNGFKYTVSGGAAVLVGCTRADDDMLIIPAELDGWTVSGIETGFLGEDRDFDTVVIPSTVTSVAKYSVYGADVKKIIFPAGLDNIPEDAFCTKSMIDAYSDYIGSIGGGNLGELEPIGTAGIVKPVGSALTVYCAAGSGADSYADGIGADKQVISGYTGAAGDINCDGALNNRDLKQLQKYINGEDAFFTPSFDADGSGAVDDDDISRLQRYLAGENVTVY